MASIQHGKPWAPQSSYCVAWHLLQSRTSRWVTAMAIIANQSPQICVHPHVFSTLCNQQHYRYQQQQQQQQQQGSSGTAPTAKATAAVAAEAAVTAAAHVPATVLFLL